MRRTARRLMAALWLVALVGGLVACGETTEEAPRLAAPPTRTPQPPTPTPSLEDRLANFEIIFLNDAIEAYLDAAEGRSPIDRPDIFSDVVIAAEPACFTSEFYTGMEPLELLGFNPVSVDNESWRTALAATDRVAIEAQARAALSAIVAQLPVDYPVRLCVVPLPHFQPDGAPDEGGQEGIHGAEVFGSDLIITWCSGGASCLDHLNTDLAYAYHYAYQIAHTGLAFPEVPLLHFALYAARAAEFTRALFPDAVYDWDEFTLTPEEEAVLWSRMQPYLRTTNSDGLEARKIERFLAGRENSPDYPRWGGMVIAERILDAYRAGHPDVSWAELAALPPETVLNDSGYSPG